MNMSVLSESPVKVNCTAAGFPLPSISWMFNGALIENSSTIDIQNFPGPQNTVVSVLIFEPIDFTSLGAYECNAFNNMMSNTSLVGFITVVGMT